MQLKLYQQMIFFRTYTLHFIQIHLIYAQQKNNAPTIYAFSILLLCNVENLNCTFEQMLRRFSGN